MTEPKITVLLPVYNGADHLAEAVESILAQTFTDFELLVVDDGSTDESLAIMASYNDPRIRLVRNPSNLGISATLNRGLELAAAPWIARMDADDRAHPQRLEKQWAFVQAHDDVALLCTWVYDVSADGSQRSPRPFHPPAFFYNLYFTCWIYHPTVLFRRSVVQALGGYTARYAEDYDLWWRLMQHHRFAVLPAYLLDYRLSAQSLHQVTHKKEYEEAHVQQVRRNLQSLPHCPPLSDAEIKALCFNPLPLMAEGSVGNMVRLLRKQKTIAKDIAQSNSPNCQPADVAAAAQVHRRHLLTLLLRGLPKTKSLLLALRTGAWRLWATLLLGYFRQR